MYDCVAYKKLSFLSIIIIRVLRKYLWNKYFGQLTTYFLRSHWATFQVRLVLFFFLYKYIFRFCGAWLGWYNDLFTQLAVFVKLLSSACLFWKAWIDNRCKTLSHYLCPSWATVTLPKSWSCDLTQCGGSICGTENLPQNSYIHRRTS